MISHDSYAWTSGTSGLLLAYALTLAALWAGCWTVRKPWTAYLWYVPLAIPVMMVTASLWSMVALAIPSQFWQTLLGIVFMGAISYGAGCVYLRNRGPTWMRGAVLAPTAAFNGRRSSRWWFAGGSAPQPDKHDVTLARIPVPPADETKHFKLIGTTGTGKSTAIRELLEGALRRGDRAVIADPDGGYLARFHSAERGDVILNPFRPESRKWDLFAEIKSAYDPDDLARSLISEGQGDERVWREYARTLLAAILRRAPETEITDTMTLYRTLATAPREELEGILEGTPAQPFIQGGNEKMFGSIRSVATSALASLIYVNAQHSALFSVRRWIREGRGVLFLPYKATEIAALKSIISTWMRLAIFETLSLEEGDARLWFIVDELDAVGAIDGLKDALARLRKFGGRCVLGFQSIGQLGALYPRGEADAIVENCGNTLILRCSASEGGGTARFASRLIGEREIIRRSHSDTRKPGEWLSTRTTTDSHALESAVLASEIEQLPDLRGYIKFASRPEWRRISL